MKKKWICAPLCLAAAVVVAVVYRPHRALTETALPPNRATPADVIGEQHGKNARQGQERANRVLSLDDQISFSEKELQDKEVSLRADQVVEKLNSQRLSESERQTYFDALEGVARARVRNIELRLIRLQKRINTAKGGV